MSIIYDEIKRGEKGSREKFAAIDRWLRASGCDAAILGCTELSVYRTYHGLPDYYLGRHGNPGGKVYHRLRPISCVWYRGEQRAGVGIRPYVYAPQERHSRGSPCGRLRAETNPAPTPLYPKGPMPTSARAFGLPKND